MIRKPTFTKNVPHTRHSNKDWERHGKSDVVHAFEKPGREIDMEKNTLHHKVLWRFRRYWHLSQHFLHPFLSLSHLLSPSFVICYPHLSTLKSFLTQCTVYKAAFAQVMIFYVSPQSSKVFSVSHCQNYKIQICFTSELRRERSVFLVSSWRISEWI